MGPDGGETETDGRFVPQTEKIKRVVLKTDDGDKTLDN